MENRKKRFAYIKLAILIFIIVGLPVILFFTCRDTLFSKEWLAGCRRPRVYHLHH